MADKLRFDETTGKWTTLPVAEPAGAADDSDEPACPACGSENFSELGELGNARYMRCRQCGTDFRADDYYWGAEND